MGVYLVTNTTNLSGNPTQIAIADIPNCAIFYIEPGETIDLELACTRNQILESRHLREHVLAGRATVDTQGTSPTNRIFVDASISGLSIEDVTISGPISSSNFPNTVDTNYGSVGNSTLRTAAQLGNTTGQADFNAGATGAQTLRTTSNLSDGYGNKITSSTSSDGLKTPVDVSPVRGSIQHFNGTVGTAAITITPSSTTTAILISNPVSNASGVVLSVSFDGGTSFFDLEYRAALELEAEVSSFQIKASAASSNYQILVTRR